MHVLQSRVLLRPAHFDRSVAFYEEALGLVRYREWGAPPHRGVVFFLGGGYLELSEAGASAPPSSPRAHVRLWLQVEDAAVTYQELESAGVAIEAPPQRMPWGLVEMTVLDPDGLELIVVETPADHPLRRDTRT